MALFVSATPDIWGPTEGRVWRVPPASSSTLEARHRVRCALRVSMPRELAIHNAKTVCKTHIPQAWVQVNVKSARLIPYRSRAARYFQIAYVWRLS